MAPKAQIVLFDDRVEKRQSESLARRELSGTEAGRQVADQCGHFRVPKVLTSDVDAGLIVFERISQAESLRKILPGIADSGRLICGVARSLAAIHELGEPQQNSADEDFSHGDFSIDNLFYVESADQLYVFDWSSPVWRDVTQCNDRYHDLSVFVFSLFTRPVFYPKRIRQVSRLAATFFDVYRDNAEFDPRRLERSFTRLANEFMPYSYRLSRWRFVANYPSLLRCRRFVARLGR